MKRGKSKLIFDNCKKYSSQKSRTVAFAESRQANLQFFLRVPHLTESWYVIDFRPSTSYRFLVGKPVIDL